MDDWFYNPTSKQPQQPFKELTNVYGTNNYDHNNETEEYGHVKKQNDNFRTEENDDWFRNDSVETEQRSHIHKNDAYWKHDRFDHSERSEYDKDYNDRKHETCDEPEEKPLSKLVISQLNKLLNPHVLIDTSDMALEILRMDPSHPLHSAKSFQDLPLSLPLLKGISSLGFYKPSTIQEKALPILLSNNPPNLIAQSQSGTGKTATFLLAMLSRCDPTLPYCQALCMVPTRELATQLAAVGRKMAKNVPELTFGLAIRDPKVTTDEDGYINNHIVIGTPGTIASWLRCTGDLRLDASGLKMFVLDEADVMIDVEGFFNIAMRVKQRLPDTCQLLLFSATFEDEVIDFAREFVPNPTEMRLRRTQLPLKNIRQFYLQFNDWHDKYRALCDIYGGFDVGQAIIFCRTRKEAHWLESRLNEDSHRVAVLSGDLEVSERENILLQFREAKCRVLIATNLCARGLDVPQVNLIINWNMPVTRKFSADCDTYLHRIGRSGRFGKDSVAVNFITSDELHLIKELEEYFDINIPLLSCEDVFEF